MPFTLGAQDLLNEKTEGTKFRGADLNNLQTYKSFCQKHRLSDFQRSPTKGSNLWFIPVINPNITQNGSE